MRGGHTLAIWLPPKLLPDAERTAQEESRTKSELVREALRFYLEERYWRRFQRQVVTRAQALGI